MDVYIKLDPATNNVECLSTDGLNCIKNNLNFCKNPTGTIKPLICGVALKNTL